MRRLPGQAGRLAARILHRAVQLALALVIVAACLVAALAWRLSEGPLEIAWIARRLEAAANGDGPTKLAIGSAALAWDGYRYGLDRPLVIRLADVTVKTARGSVVAALPHGELSLSAGMLLLGRIVPRGLEIDGARVHLTRATDGATTVDLGGLGEQPPDAPAAEKPPPAADGEPPPNLPDLLRQFTQPPQSDHGRATSRWSQLRTVHVRDSEIRVTDRQLGADWRAAVIRINLVRVPRGGVGGSADVTLAMADQQLGLHIDADLDAARQATALRVRLTPLIPSHLAKLGAGLAPLAALEAPVTLSGEADLGMDLIPRGARLHAELGAGQVHVGRGVTTLADAVVDAEGSAAGAKVVVEHLSLVPRPGGPRTTVRGHAEATRANGHVAIAATLDLDQANFVDLPALWPEGTGGPGTRPWITANITAGIARNGHVELAMRAPEDFSDATLNSIAGGLDGRDLTLHWLRPVPPIEHIDGHLNFTAPDIIDIAMTSGHQTGGAQGGLNARSGKVHLIGIAGHDQFADIEADLQGPLADLLTLLKHPKIRLLDRRPIPMHDPAGQIAGKLTVTHLPLKDNLSLDDIQIHTAARLAQVHLGGIAAGRDLDRGALSLDAGNDGLHIKGSADIAHIPAELAVDMDFRSGPPTQVLQKVTVSGVATQAQLVAAGMPAQGVVTGAVGLTATMTSQRGGRGDITVRLDLQRTAMAMAELNMTKIEGQAGSGEAHVVLDHDRLASVDHVRIQAPGIDVRGAADVASGRPNVLRLERAAFGRTDVHGEIRLPDHAGAAYGVTLAGPSLDASGLFTERAAQKPTDAAPRGAATERTPFTTDIRFDKVILARGQSVTGVVGHVVHDGRLLREARIEGRTAPAAPFRVSVEPRGGGREVRAAAADVGALLRAADVMTEMQGGRLAMTASYDDRSDRHPLSGTVEINDFRLRGAAALGKILQAMTLYGIVDVLTGPGLNFTRLVAPFRYEGERIHLGDARAFSSSLGLTAKGDIDLGRRVADVEGTIVPAYFLNAALGHVPLIGRIFSPETGGGVFSATYTVRGGFDDPSIGVNPLAALTPGFLRGIFGIFSDRR